MQQVHVGANCFSRIISAALGGWPTRCQGICPPLSLSTRPRRCRKVTSTLRGVRTMRSKMPAKSAVGRITSYTHRISERRSLGLMGNSRTCNNRLRKPSSGNQTQETKFRKPNSGDQTQEIELRNPSSGSQTQESTRRKRREPSSDLGSQTQEASSREPNSEK